MLKAVSIRAALFALTVSLSATTYAVADAPKQQVDIPAGDLSNALLELSHRYGADLIYRTDQVRGLQTRGVHGQFTTEEAVGHLLEGTSLRLSAGANGSMLIAAPLSNISAIGTGSVASPGSPPHSSTVGEGQGEDPNKEAGKNSSRDFRVAQVDQTSAGPPAVDQEKPEEKKSALEEIVVTGSHIRGVTNTASPVEVYSREDIDSAGVATLNDFVQKLPANFGGVANEGTISTIAGGNAAGQNLTFGSAINLRGLGPDATLLLIDGHRVAPGSVRGSFSDISLIPVGAIERIDVLTDGASAVYGADAVGGVVNVIMLKDFEGAETRARYGFAPDGGARELQAAETLGRGWGSGSTVVSYEYFDRTPIEASQRSFTEAAAEPFNLLPEQVRHSAVMSLQQSVGSSVSVFGEGSYAKRSSLADVSSPVGYSFQYAPTITDQSVIVGARADMTHDIALEVSGSYNSANSWEHYLNLLGGASPNADHTRTSITSYDAKLDGPVVTIPTGTVRFAVGGQYRKETFDSASSATSPSGVQLSRTVGAGFAEFDIPIVGPRGGSSANYVDLNLAVRTEHYSDFGSSTNPKVGLTWEPDRSVAITGTFGTSFRAPLLWDVNPKPYDVVITPEPDPTTGQNTNGLIAYGGNPNLEPEKARTWTAGVKFRPELVPGLQAKVSYYNIHFSRRITSLDATSYDTFNALASEAVLGPTFVQRNPPLALLQQLVSTAGTFADYTGVPGGAPLTSIGAFIDSREFNLSTLNTSGIDFALSYRKELAFVTAEAGVDGSWILKYEQRLLANSPLISILDTPFNPVDLRLRARGILSHGNWTFAAYINYVNSYTDNRNEPAVPVTSWTTEDVTLGYRIGSGSGLLNDSSVILGVINLTNASPPYVLNNAPAFWRGINFDGTNANALGRSVSLQLSKRF